ncbi:MAG: class I SAM-dependent methyltransferase [Dehalococcoidia bacterium]
MPGTQPSELNDAVRQAWERNAGFWDGVFGADGNDTHRLLIAPVQMRLLALRPGERVFEVACGNGAFAREMARAGAHVVACDFSATFIERAKQRTQDAGLAVDYHVADATSETELLALGEPASFDAAVCTMAMMDIADINTMLQALAKLLRPGARFVFSIMHPCFNGASPVMVAETADAADGTVSTTYSIKVSEYLHTRPRRGTGIIGQPEPHYYFQRPLSELFGACFDAGFVLDGIEEPAFRDAARPDRPLSWKNYAQIPPVLVARLRLAG